MNESTKYLLRQNAAILSQDESVVLNRLMAQFPQAVYDPKQNLYILYNRNALLHDAAVSTAYAKNITCRILNLRSDTDCLDHIEQYNPYKQAVQFENLMNSITDEYQLQQIFDCLPYTKDKRFNLTGHIHIRMLQFTMPAFASNPEKTVNHLALTIWPFSGASGYSALCSDYESLPMVSNIAVMLYTPPKYISGDKCPPNILQDDGTFQKAKTKRPQKTLAVTTLTPGTSYLDSKGIEHLYLGKLTRTNSIPNYPDSRTVKTSPTPMYLRITDTVREQLNKAPSMTEFLKNRLEEKARDPKSPDILTGISQIPDKKLKMQKTVFFQTPYNLVNNLRILRKNPSNPIADQLSIISTE